MKIQLTTSLPVDKEYEMIEGNEYEIVRHEGAGKVVVKSHANGEEIVVLFREYRILEH